MITGHNTDITYNGVIYHVQTEDKGHLNPVVETLVYRGGEILDARRTSYSDILTTGYDEKKIISIIDEQHKQVIYEIKSGKYDLAAALLSDPLTEGLIDSKKSLDQVILEYLASEEEKERMELELKNGSELIEGKSTVLSILAKNSKTGKALKGVNVVIKIISTIKKPVTLHEGKTDKNGMVSVEFTVPEFPDGDAALLIQAFSEFGSDEIKQFLVKR